MHGEDAWFVMNRSDASSGSSPVDQSSRILAALGVADGVGGYVRFGSEGSAAMARSLMHNCAKEVASTASSHAVSPRDARQIIAQAFQ